MKNLNTKLVLHIVVSLILFFHISATPQTVVSGSAKQNNGIDEILKKEKVRILITDSGLGGLSVLAGIDDVLRRNNIFSEVELYFVNALPNANYRYNTMPDEATKIKVFSSALDGMYKYCKPDIILIACNTLSVLYDKTEFSKSAKIPVLNIVDFGVELILNELKQNPKSGIVILGTETTITAGSHKAELVKKGVNEKQITEQSCPNLESEIQNDAKSDMVNNLTDYYIDEAVGKINDSTKNITAALCCTHYGYAATVFENALKDKFKGGVKVVNPNVGMINAFNVEKYFKRFPDCKINVKIISQAEISDEEKTSIGGLIKTVSPASADALNNYILKTDLFNYK